MAVASSRYQSGTTSFGSAVGNAGEIKEQVARIHNKLAHFLIFIKGEHISLETVKAVWRHERRATLMFNQLGKALDVELTSITHTVRDLLDATTEMALPEFCAGAALDLFAAIDSIAPDDASVGDGRRAAERFHYAAEARTVLLNYTLSIISQRYPTITFTSFTKAADWTRAFSALLQESEEIIVGTQQLLSDEATAVQSYLDHLRSQLELLDAQAKGAAVFLRSEWRHMLADAEHVMLMTLEQRYDRLAAMTFNELRETRETGWLEIIAQATMRHAPALGTLLLTLAGGATMMAAQRSTYPALPAPQNDQRSGTFPVLARHAVAEDEVFRGVQDDIRRFFSAFPRPSGRVSLTLPDQATLTRVLDELTHFGYARREVMRLLGLSSVIELTSPMTLDVRWSQGGRPLVLPPYAALNRDEPISLVTPTENSATVGIPISVLASNFGLRAEQILAANFLLNSPATVSTGQLIEVPEQNWTDGTMAGGITYGASLAEVATILNLSEVTIADLNDIAAPENWQYTGQRLLLPTAPENANRPVTTTTPDLAMTAPQSAIPTVVTFVGEARPVTSLIVHHVLTGENLDAIAARYGTSAVAIQGDNELSDTLVMPGQLLLVRVNGRVAEVSTPQPGLIGAAGVQSSGSFPSSTAQAVSAPTGVSWEQLRDQYGSTMYPTVADMPPEMQAYFNQTVQEVADFFNVRPGDIIGILQAENNNAGLRIYQPSVSTAGAMGVGQIIARTWNGWSNPAMDSHILNLVSIQEHGGLGFDWQSREAWQAWQAGRADASILASANADPVRFDNSIAGVARHLVHWGLTRDVAEQNPDAFQTRLLDAISVYNSGRPLAEAENFTQSVQNQKTTGQYVREAVAMANATPLNLLATIAPTATATAPAAPVVAAPVVQSSPLPPAMATLTVPDSPLVQTYREMADYYLGANPTAQEIAERVTTSMIAADVAAGKISADDGASQLFTATVHHYMAQGRAAHDAGQPVAWPYIWNDESLVVQQSAVQYLGHTLSAWEVEQLLTQIGGDADALTAAVANRDDARLFAGAQLRFDRILRRSERGLPITNYEVAALLQPLLAGYPTQGLSASTMEGLLTQFETAVRQTSEFREIGGVATFTATPLSPMPRLTKPFGAPVDYQKGGMHTGIDAAGSGSASGEPTIYAVGAGTVVHVGPLFCDAPRACRGPHAIIVDHGDNVYSIYSHNSKSQVAVGQGVSGGQAIALQGNEGYSFGSHLHFEVHTGAPYSGEWETPFNGGQFEDPMKWLPD